MSPSPLQVSDLSFAYSDAVPVLGRVSFTLPAGVTGVVGATGAGKSTLLGLLSGALAPTRGAVRVPGPVAVCPQDPVLDDGVRAFAWGWHDGAWALQARLGLDPASLDRWDTLSPGERRRWQLGAAFAAAPVTLLLDEPTNHLDREARAWLSEAVRAHRGLVVLVTHDRAFADAVCDRTLRLARGAATVSEGGYTTAKESWDAAEARALSVLEAAGDAARRAARALADTRRARDAAQASTRTSARMKGLRDHDARSALAKGKAAAGLAARSRQVGVARAEAGRAQERLDTLARPHTDGADLTLRSAPGAPGRLLAWRGEVRLGDRLFSDVEQVLGRGDRLHLDGPNGSGKSTLLRALRAACTLPTERVLWLPQELPAAETFARLDRLRALPSDARGRVAQVLAALGVEPARLLASAAPSPGEARKLALAEGLGRGAWLALLDEPTNHLDLPSIERLQAALQRWDGALVLVTHDPALAAATTNLRRAWPPP